ncbi:zincin-like metallopeptidase domain-containing protein [Labilibaculum sp. K2S]|uniref:zincin-like metallopeptidase domain-containing protein n=1 Tax=Labilibaculum sp. K2S TaxID=3056386 RepID=UPI0025A465A9|nr:zincin-like metallopeptidase domain-containing protein [Labilibaculum sp. K2S]MDM8159035.1 zincin-like metallopeptidase domain-containing protein [Labilibaculum sp. K2S]
MLGLFNTEPKTKAKQSQKLSLSGILKGILDVSLEGWSEDKEKFKTELLNDIKDFLFTKWEKPWKAGLIFDESGKLLSGFRNISGRVYKNLSNILSLALNSNKNPFFITLKKLTADGGTIEDKSKTVQVVSYVPMWKDKANKTPRPADYFLPKYHRAINLEYVSGIKKPALKIQHFEKLELNQYVENFIKELVKRKRIPKLYYDQADSCHYKHSLMDYNIESIHMVKIDTFKKIESYYSVLFHEITHSTQNPKRLGRGKSLGYANEELVAEMGAMIICEELGLQYNRQNSLVYLKGWLKGTKNVDHSLLEAYSFASDAAEYLLKDIDLEKLVPDSMRKRASDTQEKKTVEKTAKKQTKPQSKPQAKQLTLLGHTQTKTADKTVINLAKWKANTQITALGGALGKFIGGFERNRFSVVLRGEKGAGKTRLLCQLINLFAGRNLKSLFLSLEVSPQSELFGNYISYIEKKTLKNVSVSAESDLEQLEKYAKQYDVIAIDSWGKLDNLNQSDFGRLIEKYPKVIWLVIFQSTTNGTVRGGIMSEYDSSIVIQVAKGGFAECEKNRYNTCDLVYNVFNKKLVKNENI